VTSRIATCYIVLSLLPAGAAAQSPSTSAGERLSLEAAIKLAVESNRSLATAKLQLQKAEEDLAVSRTRKRPSFETTLDASQLLTPVKFSFPTGSFGTYPGIGPVPGVDSEVTTPTRPTFYAFAQLTQPLSQLQRIGFGIKGAEATRDIERERTRQQQLSLVNGIKRLYFAIQQTESSLRATDEAIALYRELDRTLEVRVAQKVALRSDALDVQFRLAQEELTKLTRTNTLASQKEQLNQLLGRDVRTVFETETIAPMTPLDINVEAAQTRALETRPDVKEARLKVEQADLDRRAKKSERIPDISLAVGYLSNFNIDVMPKNLATVGVQLKWEPFDWGRRGRELASKTHTVDQARLAVRDTEDKVVLEINSHYRKLAEARAFLNVAQMAQSATRERLRVKTNQFQIQAALLSDVMQLRAELAETNDQYQQALLTLWTAKADFELAAGEEVIR
jgi:outer membrane protein TolC